MRSTVENWNGTDADLLTELNRKQFKRVIGNGLVTLPMIADVSVELAAGLNYTLEQVIASLQQSDPVQASFVSKFHIRLTESSFGIDLGNDTLRAQMTALLTGAGWTAEQINAVLSIGAAMESIADRSLGRDAVQADLDETRAAISREQIQADYHLQFASLIQPKLETGTRSEIAVAMRSAADAIEGG